MNNIVKAILILGFIASIFTNIFLLLVFTAIIALYTYPVSITLRGIGWLSSFGLSKLNILTGLAVLVMGFSIFIGLIGEDISDVSMVVYLWSIYSLVEAYTYYKLRTYSPMFKMGLISIPSIVYANIIVLLYSGEILGLTNESDIVIYFIPSFILNILSCIGVLLGIANVKGLE